MSGRIVQERWGKYRFNSIFFRTFLMVLLICSLLIGGFLLYFVVSENRSLKKEAESATRNMLRTNSMATELTLTNLQLLMNQTIWEKEFTSAMITPNRENYTRTTAILTRLRQIAQDYASIDKAFLFIPTDDTVYSSDQSYMKTEETSYELFRDREYLEAVSGPKLTDSHESLFIKSAYGKVYLCQHLYPDYIRSIGMLIFEINLQSVKAGSEEDDYSVFDRQGSAVFPSETAALKDISHWMSRISNRMEGTLEGEENESYYYYRSALTGWVYLEPRSLSGPFLQWRKIVGMVTAAILLGLFLALQASARIHRPVRELMGEVAQANPGAVDAKNEIDYLSQVYRSQSEQNRELRQTLKTVTPLVKERTRVAPADSSQHIRRVQEYLDEKYADPNISLDMAAEYAGLSGSYLSRLFKQSLDMTFVEYLNSLRVEKAQELLAGTDLKIMDIAEHTGFNSSQSFFRIFKKYAGMSPGDYRQSRRTKLPD